MADYVSGEEKCGAPAPNGASVCALPPGHENQHRNAWYAPWPASGRCTYIYGPNGNRCAFANGDEQHDHRTSTRLGYVHQDQWRPVQSAEHTPQTGGPGMQPCGNVGPFAGITCKRTVGHSGHHKHTAAGTTSVWSDVTEESVAKQLAGLQRKVRAQANQINKLEELRRAAVDKQPEHQALKRDLDSQASLTMRENALRTQAETDRDKERERGDRFQEELRRALAKSGRAESADAHAERTRRFTSRFYRLASLLGVDTAGETWDSLFQRVADLKAELEVERVRANARKAELTKQDAARLLMGPSAEYGTTPLAARVAELAKRVNELEHETVRRCESWNSGTRCVGYTRHAGAHSGPGTERWA